jgi:thiamine biosynthesis lipoprotein ApbE
MTYQHIDDSTGVLISHIYDPVKKKSTQTKDNITIITKDATTADWMATACSILPKKKMAKMLKKFPYPIEMIRAPRYE